MQQGARTNLQHQRTKRTKIADEMQSQRIRDGTARRRRRQITLFNLKAATMYQLFSILILYLMFTTHSAVQAADNQLDGGGNNDLNDGFTVGPEAITTPFGECFLFVHISSNIFHKHGTGTGTGYTFKTHI